MPGPQDDFFDWDEYVEKDLGPRVEDYARQEQEREEALRKRLDAMQAEEDEQNQQALEANGVIFVNAGEAEPKPESTNDSLAQESSKVAQVAKELEKADQLYNQASDLSRELQNSKRIKTALSAPRFREDKKQTVENVRRAIASVSKFVSDLQSHIKNLRNADCGSQREEDTSSTMKEHLMQAETQNLFGNLTTLSKNSSVPRLARQKLQSLQSLIAKVNGLLHQANNPSQDSVREQGLVATDERVNGRLLATVRHGHVNGIADSDSSSEELSPSSLETEVSTSSSQPSSSYSS